MKTISKAVRFTLVTVVLLMLAGCVSAPDSVMSEYNGYIVDLTLDEVVVQFDSEVDEQVIFEIDEELYNQFRIHKDSFILVQGDEDPELFLNGMENYELSSEDVQSYGKDILVGKVIRSTPQTVYVFIDESRGIVCDTSMTDYIDRSLLTVGSYIFFTIVGETVMYPEISSFGEVVVEEFLYIHSNEESIYYRGQSYSHITSSSQFEVYLENDVEGRFTDEQIILYVNEEFVLLSDYLITNDIQFNDIRMFSFLKY